jgi:hypothetical protein
VKFVVGAREQIVLILDWTEFDSDAQTTLCAYLASDHGRATPLVWQTVPKSTLKGQRTDIEHAMIGRIHGWLDPKIEVELLADRGFGDQKLDELLTLYGWDFTIRFRGNIRVESAEGEARPAHEWLSPTARARMLRCAKVTADRAAVPAVVVVHARGM